MFHTSVYPKTLLSAVLRRRVSAGTGKEPWVHPRVVMGLLGFRELLARFIRRERRERLVWEKLCSNSKVCRGAVSGCG